MTTAASGATQPPGVGDVVAALEARYPPGTAEAWDRVGLVVGEPAASVRRVLFVVDCVAETVDEAITVGADLIVAHHPLLLRGVHSVATTSHKGALVHRLIRAGVALFVAHTNADSARPGVSDALADRLGLTDIAPMAGAAAHPLRTGRLAEPLTLAALAEHAAACLPATAGGVRAGGDPDRLVRTMAVAGGAGDDFLADATAAGVDAYLTADLRHHPASEHLAAGGPALLDVAHWATERPWLDVAAADLRADLGPDVLDVVASDVVTDVWTAYAPMRPPR
ncbi:MAG: Nif3-like dinuclear metal center hexameric protein [Micromonosporaceae bacterium]